MRPLNLLLVAPMLVLFAGNAIAESPDVCTGYAKEATGQQALNVRDSAPGYTPPPTAIPDLDDSAFSCGFTGPRWTSDSNAHYQWCLGATIQQLNAESDAREYGLHHCALCKDYADQELKQAATARDLHCKVTGARWKRDSAGDYQWCMSQASDPEAAETYEDNSQNAVNADLATGQKQIDACKVNRIKERMTSHKPDYNAVKRPAGAGKADLGLAGKGINQDALDDPNCLRCRSTKARGVGKDSAPNQLRGGGTAMDRLGGVNDNLGSVSGNAGGAQMGRSTSQGAGGASPASTGGGTSSGAGGGLGAAGRTFVPAPPRIDTSNSPSSIH